MKNYKSFTWSMKFIYFVVAFFMLLMVLICYFCINKKVVDFGLKSFTVITDQWKLTDGSCFDASQIDSYVDHETNTLTIYYPLTDQLDHLDSIVFRTKNCSVEVSIDQEVIYRTDVATAPFYNHSPGTRWNILHLENTYRGKILSIEITLAYDDGRAKIDNIFIGDNGGILIHIISSKANALLIGIFMFIIGVLFLICNLILNKGNNNKNHSLVYLGLFAIICSLWCLIETNVFQLFTYHLRLLQLVDNITIVIGATTLLLYTNETFHIFRSRIYRGVAIFNIGCLILATTSQYIHGPDFHETLGFSVTSYIFVVITLVICTTLQAFRDRKSTKLSRLFFLQRIGILALALSVLADFIRYITMDVLDRAYIVRFGLLICILCFGAESIYNMVVYIKQGYKADIVSKLAYQDGLTEVGNRTAYKEQIEKFCKTTLKGQLMIIMFDINNLKQVNDTLGHSVGDLLIKAAANVISNAFAGDGTVYRIGGDEFIVLLFHQNVSLIYEHCSEQFEKEITLFNEQKRYPFTLAIAVGSCIVSTLSLQTIEEAEKDADKRMYKNKELIKSKIIVIEDPPSPMI